MLPPLSINALYTLALAEGEGVGTAYEYYVKRRLLSAWLARGKRPQRILIAGLPEKYGASLDFLQLTADFQATATVIDERPAALEKLQASLAAAQAQGWLSGVAPRYRLVDGLAAPGTIEGTFDLALSSEVLSRITAVSRSPYYRHLQKRSRAVALFAPNAANAAHTSLSGLSGLHLREMRALVSGAVKETPGESRFGYADMPPFPPGIVRSEAQRAQASSGKPEALAMWGLGFYARLEKFFPLALRRRHAHIVYALLSFTHHPA